MYLSASLILAVGTMATGTARPAYEPNRALSVRWHNGYRAGRRENIWSARSSRTYWTFGDVRW